jgi:hypothetical protein
MGVAERCGPEESVVCPSCATLMDDVQDRSIIESALPHQRNPSSGESAQGQAVLAPDESEAAHKLHIGVFHALAAAS